MPIKKGQTKGAKRGNPKRGERGGETPSGRKKTPRRVKERPPKVGNTGKHAFGQRDIFGKETLIYRAGGYI